MTTPVYEDGLRLSITRVWARNFKSIRELDLELGPLTVLVGPNASGKSNVLDVLRFISDALRRSLDAAVTTRQGIGAVRRTTRKGRPPDVEVGFRAERGTFRFDYSFVLGSRSEGLYYVKREYGVVTPSDRGEEPIDFEIRDGRLVKPQVPDGEPFETSELALPSLRHILFWHPVESGGRRYRATRTSIDVTNVLNFFGLMQFYRLFPDDMREPRKPMNSLLLAEDGSNLASVLREMKRRRSPYLGEIKSTLGQVVSGLTDVDVKQAGGFFVVKMQHSGANGGGAGSTFDLSQESDGTVRLLGLLTALYQERPGSLMGIEEPGLTIHPGAQAVLADVMIEAASRTQVLVTTHSPDLIDRLPIESLRAVQIQDGCTKVGQVSDTQVEAVRDGLFTSGELHSMEGLEPRA
jgi:predicted ATPase